jgi:hypothetical protein
MARSFAWQGGRLVRDAISSRSALRQRLDQLPRRDDRMTPSSGVDQGEQGAKMTPWDATRVWQAKAALGAGLGRLQRPGRRIVVEQGKARPLLSGNRLGFFSMTAHACRSASLRAATR